MNGLFVVLSSACAVFSCNNTMLEISTSPTNGCISTCSTNFERIQTSTEGLKDGEYAYSLCRWIDHKWEVFDPCPFIKNMNSYSYYRVSVSECDAEIEKCAYCDRKRRKVTEERWVEE